MVRHSSASSPAPGDLLDGRYRLVDVLARGGSATVWRGHDERLSRGVAIKILAAGPNSSYEARSLAQLSHPHIAAVFDCGTHRDRAYLVLELIDGPSLARVLADHRIPGPAAIVAAAQTASALAAAHSCGLVHRDVTPRNIMLGPGGVKLVDFGISAASGDSEIDADGGLRGTPMYAAPERLHGRAVGPSSDVYALGVVLYRSLSGRLPGRRANCSEPAALPEPAEPAPLPAVAGLPQSVIDLCMRCLDRDPAIRPSAAEAEEVLRSGAPPDALARFAVEAWDSAGPVVPVSSGAAAFRRPSPRNPGRLAALTAAAALVWMTAWSATDWATSDQPPPQFAVVMPPMAAEPPTSGRVTGPAGEETPPRTVREAARAPEPIPGDEKQKQRKEKPARPDKERHKGQSAISIALR